VVDEEGKKSALFERSKNENNTAFLFYGLFLLDCTSSREETY